MKIYYLVIVMLLLFLSGCVFQNPYRRFYHDRTGGIDISKCQNIKLPTGEPKIILGSNASEDTQNMFEDGYDLLGASSFNAGDDVNQDDLIAQAKSVKAEIAISYSRYTHTKSGIAPWILPDNKTINTTYSGMENCNGNIYGNNGGWASYSGTSSLYGQANTTVYGSKTVYIPYSHNRYDYLASYWIKLKAPVFGVIAADLTAEQRANLATNKGACVTIVIKGSPAFEADIFKGDIITKINNDDVIDAQKLKYLESKYFGEKVRVSITRSENILIKEIQFSGGEKIYDEKYGKIAEAYYVFCNSAIGFVKTASIHFGKIFNSYHKSKEYGFTFEELKYNDDIRQDQRALGFLIRFKMQYQIMGRKISIEQFSLISSPIFMKVKI